MLSFLISCFHMHTMSSKNLVFVVVVGLVSPKASLAACGVLVSALRRGRYLHIVGLSGI